MEFARSSFPKSFQFGAAASAYQIEGHAFGGAGSTHWDSFAATPGNVVNGENGATACDHYHRFEADFDLLRDAGLDAYRFSTSWARVLPEGRGTPNQEGLDYYDRLVDALLARGLRPFQTLYHWELPSALADLGGWANRDIAGWFADYVDVIDRRIGDRVAATATINEPWCVAYLSHFLGAHAPGLRDIRAAARAMHHVLLAHGTAITRLRDAGRENLGIVLNFDYQEAADDTPENLDATRLSDALFNRWYIEGVTRGTYPAEALAMVGPYLPANWQDDMATISQPIDWLGVNYYTRHLVTADPAAPGGYRSGAGHLATTQMGWEIYPDGLYHFLTLADREYMDGKPIFVTENGMAWDDRVRDGSVKDPERCAFIDAHLQAVRRAIADGANVQGYFYWSLLDNYEWADGYSKRFGLVHVDYQTQERTPKHSYHQFKEALAR